MTKIKKYGIISLVINLIFTLGGAGLFLYFITSLDQLSFEGMDLSGTEYGPFALLMLVIVGAMFFMLLIVPLVHFILGGFNSLMMILQIFTGKSGFSIPALFVDILMILIDAGFAIRSILFVFTGYGAVALVFVIPLAMAITSLVLHIKALGAKGE